MEHHAAQPASHAVLLSGTYEQVGKAIAKSA